MKSYYRFFIVLLALSLCHIHAMAQTEETILHNLGNYDYRQDTTIHIKRDSVVDVAVYTNSWKHNWFAAFNVGYQKFWGDYNEYGKFSQTLSPDFYLSGGRWMTPSIGFGAELGYGRSFGFTTPEHKTPYTMRNELFYTKDGKEYYRQRIKWWDIGVNLHLNMTRMILGYEGVGHEKRMGNFIMNIGVGWVHHFGFEQGNPTLNEISGKVDLQYSRFLTKAKRLSFDTKLRFTFYQTNFDGNYDYAGCQKWDYNIGLAFGLTFHSKRNSWTKPLPIAYQVDYKIRDQHITVTEAPVEKIVNLQNFTFYMLYPDDKTVGIENIIGRLTENGQSYLDSIRGMGYLPLEDDRLFCLDDVYGAVAEIQNEKSKEMKVDRYAVDELKHILMDEAIIKITVMSASSSNETNDHAIEAEKVRVADNRAQDAISLLKKVDRLKNKTVSKLLVNSLDINRTNSVKISVQYLKR